MASSSPRPTSRALLRKQLSKLLSTDADLEAFLLDYFPAVARRISGGMDRIEKLNLLLRSTDIDRIWARLRENFPNEVPAASVPGPARLPPQAVEPGN